MHDPKDPILRENLVPITVWTSALGKLLVQKGVITKAELIAEIEAFRNVPHIAGTETDVDLMINTIKGW
jgi:hypothetical protein